MRVVVSVCLKDCVEVIKHSAKKQEHGAAGRIIFNQVRTKEMCNFLLRAERTPQLLKKNIWLFQRNGVMGFWQMTEIFSQSFDTSFYCYLTFLTFSFSYFCPLLSFFLECIRSDAECREHPQECSCKRNIL